LQLKKSQVSDFLFNIYKFQKETSLLSELDVTSLFDAYFFNRKFSDIDIKKYFSSLFLIPLKIKVYFIK